MGRSSGTSGLRVCPSAGGAPGSEQGRRLCGALPLSVVTALILCPPPLKSEPFSRSLWRPPQLGPGSPLLPILTRDDLHTLSWGGRHGVNLSLQLLLISLMAHTMFCSPQELPLRIPITQFGNQTKENKNRMGGSFC